MYSMSQPKMSVSEQHKEQSRNMFLNQLHNILSEWKYCEYDNMFLDREYIENNE